MIGKTPTEHQMSIFEIALESFIDMNHELFLLSKRIDWEAGESEFSEYYCADNDCPSVPIRKMVGMMMLKNIYSLRDEGVVARRMENPYLQYFTCEKVFQKRLPMKPIDMTEFWKRAEIDPVIGHLKSNYRMMRKYLKGTRGDAINMLMSAAAYNMRHWMDKHASSSFVSCLLTQVRRLENVLFGNEKQSACRYPILAVVA